MLTRDRLKSFVLRKGRITANQKQAIETLWDQYVLSTKEDINKFLLNRSSVLDIGFGAGETTTYLAKNMPESSVLGAEVYLAGIGSTLSKSNEEGLNNIKIVKILAAYTFILGILLVIFFYNFSSVLKNSYLLIKNNYSGDNKYLAVITKHGLWIKDEINEDINIINANKVDDKFLLNVSITKFNKNFDIKETIESKKIDITLKKWKIFNPTILKNNSQTISNEMIMESNFDLQKINSLFSNLSSLTMIDLITLRESYISLNYSVTDINSHLLKIISYPIYLTLITVFSAIIMFNISYQKNTFFKITLGILSSVIIYYINNFFHVLGTNEKIPLILSIFLPLVILSIINFTSIIRLNEK